ncbi:PREDICTED: indoleamine 2,3-dioxygenase 2 isoform X3 [Crocodylus porosus]|uniref:indoleamine 2,3-dioxygenase 2 isoform X3 n=1 Tax=Crocodylus porosus TaxID=8502 RepID=UPI000938EEDF|nr:PREDICTED: indoleamine 2,3-dioxygenase 2 isoform X3 [Crocodylus porosus]
MALRPPHLPMDPADETEQPPPPCALDKFHISPEYGFLLPDPQTELPAPYRPWMDLARSLPDLIATRQLRAHVHQAPQLSAAQLHGHRDLRLAHLVLGFITAGYVWQDGEEGPAKVLPQNLAVPFWEVSRRLGLPPILLHADLVLANWRQRDRAGPLELGNLDPIVWLPGGESLRGFVLVTMLVEKAAVPGLQAIAEAAPAIRQPNGETLLQALAQLAMALGAMTEALMQMHGGGITPQCQQGCSTKVCGSCRRRIRGAARPRAPCSTLSTPSWASDTTRRAGLCGSNPGLASLAGAGPLLWERGTPLRLQQVRDRAGRLPHTSHRRRNQVCCHRHCGQEKPRQPRDQPPAGGSFQARAAGHWRVPRPPLPQKRQGRHPRSPAQRLDISFALLQCSDTRHHAGVRS